MGDVMVLLMDIKNKKKGKKKKEEEVDAHEDKREIAHEDEDEDADEECGGGCVDEVLNGVTYHLTISSIKKDISGEPSMLQLTHTSRRNPYK